MEEMIITTTSNNVKEGVLLVVISIIKEEIKIITISKDLMIIYKL